MVMILKCEKDLLATGFVNSRYDDAIFHWHKENTVQSILSAHIHDFCWAGNLQISCFEYITNKPLHFYASE